MNRKNLRGLLTAIVAFCALLLPVTALASMPDILILLPAVITKSTKLYEAPSTRSKVVARLKKGTTVSVGEIVENGFAMRHGDLVVVGGVAGNGYSLVYTEDDLKGYIKNTTYKPVADCMGDWDTNLVYLTEEVTAYRDPYFRAGSAKLYPGTLLYCMGEVERGGRFKDDPFVGVSLRTDWVKNDFYIKKSELNASFAPPAVLSAAQISGGPSVPVYAYPTANGYRELTFLEAGTVVGVGLVGSLEGRAQIITEDVFGNPIAGFIDSERLSRAFDAEPIAVSVPTPGKLPRGKLSLELYIDKPVCRAGTPLQVYADLRYIGGGKGAVVSARTAVICFSIQGGKYTGEYSMPAGECRFRLEKDQPLRVDYYRSGAANGSLAAQIKEQGHAPALTLDPGEYELSAHFLGGTGDRPEWLHATAKVVVTK